MYFPGMNSLAMKCLKCPNQRFTCHKTCLPTLKVTQVNPSVVKTKLLFCANDFTSVFQEVDGAIIWAPSDRPLSGSIMKKMIRRIEIRPMNGVTLRPQRQSPKHVATPGKNCANTLLWVFILFF